MYQAPLLINVLIQLFFFAVLLWAIKYEDGKYFFAVAAGIIARMLLIYIHEETRIFGEADIDDYQDYFFFFGKILESDSKTILQFVDFNVPFYTFIYPGWIVTVFGEEGYWLVRFVSSLIAVLCLYPLSIIFKKIFQRRMGIGTALIILLWPTFLRYSIEVGRSAVTIILALLLVSATLRLMTEKRGILILPLGIWIVLSFYLRTEQVGFLGIFILYYIILANKQFRPRVRLVSVSLTVLVLGGVLFSLWYVYVHYLGGEVLDPAQFERWVVYRSGGGSEYLMALWPSAGWHLIFYLPVQAFYFLFSPMPWSLHGPFVAGVFLQAWTILILFIRSLIVNWKTYRSNTCLKLVVFTILFVAVGYGAVTKNAGGAARWRVPLTLLFLTILPALQRSKEKVKS
ncbi:MAG: glycosyltransferase family 39 protein [Spirochaetales bacterium]|nr:glycosyltransferase family 39 protein [Spirochaetales bacterium]MCF7937746.1 glycosyltransferase family 39 protein [Spirochaetales bacterium]